MLLTASSEMYSGLDSVGPHGHKRFPKRGTINSVPALLTVTTPDANFPSIHLPRAFVYNRLRIADRDGIGHTFFTIICFVD